MMVPSLSGVCGESELIPSCLAFGFTILYAVAIVLCIATIIGRLLFGRRLAPMLMTSGIFIVLAFLCFVPPMFLPGQNKFSGGIFLVMMVLPIFILLLSLGVVCFLVWCVHAAYQAFRDRSADLPRA
jgi:hypothetical protein